MLSLVNVSYGIEEKQLFQPISVTAYPNSIIKVKGSNGAGKTTLLRIIAGIQRPKSGEILMNGSVAYIGHNIAVKDDLTVIEQLEFWAGISGDEILIPASVRYFGLEDIMDSHCYKLSAGNRQKVAIARLLVSTANIWVLDEIDSALDEANTTLLKNLIASKSSNGGIVLFSSHREDLPYSFEIEVRG